MPRYSITIAFTADRELTSDELNTLAGHCIAQVEEPVSIDGEDMDATISDIETFSMELKV